MPRTSENSSNSTNFALASKTAYEGSVIVRATARAGRNPHLKGHVHEILFMDKRNLAGIFNGQKTALTKSCTAKTVDVISLTKAGKVCGRSQLKDVLSQSGISKLTRDVAAKQYSSAKILATKESTKLANQSLAKAGLTKQVTSSGISSETTTSLAQRAGATGSGSVMTATMNAAHSGGVIGAGIGAGITAATGIYDVYNGDAEISDVLVDTAVAGAKGYVTGYASGAAASAAGAGLAAVLATTTVAVPPVAVAVATVAVPVAAVLIVGCAVSEVWDWCFG